MTNKRKIQILKKVIKRFEKLIPKFDKDPHCYRTLRGFDGICDQINKNANYIEALSTMEIKEEFKINIPNTYLTGYAWTFTKKGYQARINACKKAIERLSRELPTAN